MKALMISASNYPLDIRVKQEAELLTSYGHEVAVIALKHEHQTFHETINKVNVYRIPNVELFKRGKHSKTDRSNVFIKLGILSMAIIGYGFEFLYFTIFSYLLSLSLIFKYNFEVIHTANPPDTLFIIACFWKIFGKKFIYDHHDLSPDLFIEKYGKNSAFIYSSLRLLEKLSCRTADYVITTNETYKKIDISRNGVDSRKVFVVRNGPDLNEMKISEPINDLKNNTDTVLCYIGAINIQDGVDNSIVVLSNIIHKYNFHNISFLIIGDGDYLYEIKNLSKKLNVFENIIFTGAIYNRELICRYLSTADIFIDTAPASFLNHSSTFIKHMEYLVFKKPVVSFSLKESMYSLQEAGLFIEPNDTDKMAKSIIQLIKDKNKQKIMGEYASKRSKELSWSTVSEPLLALYTKLNASL